MSAVFSKIFGLIVSVSDFSNLTWSPVCSFEDGIIRLFWKGRTKAMFAELRYYFICLIIVYSVPLIGICLTPLESVEYCVPRSLSNKCFLRLIFYFGDFSFLVKGILIPIPICLQTTHWSLCIFVLQNLCLQQYPWLSFASRARGFSRFWCYDIF